jgi:hypothetical protein
MDPITSGIGGLLMGGGGGLLSALGDKVNLFGGGTSGSLKMQQDASKFGLDQALQQGAGLTQAGMYNAAGDVGQMTGINFNKALQNLGPSANAIATSNKLNAMGDSALSSAGQNASLAMQQGAMQSGNTRRDIVNNLIASGANPAAIGNIAQKIGEGSNQGALTGLTEANKAYNQANVTAGSMTNQANQALEASRMANFETNVKPYMAQVNQGITALAGNLAGQGMQASQMAQQFGTANNALAGLSQGFGQLGGGLLTNSQKYLVGGK